MNIHSSLDPLQGAPRESSVLKPAGSAANPAGSAQVAAAPVLSDGDEAHLSSAALSAAASSGVSDVRADKVAAIQQALASGSYAISASDVADKLIDQLLQN